MLLTGDDTESRQRYLNARSTISALVGLRVVPVINENDTTATEELRYGDNDRLAARVAQMVSADCLAILSNIDGLYTADPTGDPGAKFVPLVDEITPEVDAMAGGAGSADGSGGMVTKLAAARIAIRAGCRTVLASGRVRAPLRVIEDGGRCTWFTSRSTPYAARKNWIASALRPSGTLVLDDGAVAALGRGKSLLPAGVAAVRGQFPRGAAVTLADARGREFGRGLCAYPADDARRIAGHKTSEIEGLLGYRGRDELIHRDDMVLARGDG